MMRKVSSHLLPVRLPPFADEVLSSWICRHATYYAVPPLVMLRHCLPEVPSLRATDLDLSANQAIRLARIFAIEPPAVRSMALTGVALSSRRLIGVKPLQSCLNCCPGHMDFRPILRSQMLGWRISCPLCGELLRDERGREVTSPFRHYLQIALRGERLLDAEAE